MRRPDDLRRAFTQHEEPVVDVAGLLKGIHSGIERRAKRLRRAGIAAVAVATAALLGLPVALTTLTSEAPVVDRPAVGPTTAMPTAETAEPERPYDPAVLGFSVSPAPEDFAIVSENTAPGSQLRSYYSPETDESVGVHSFDPALSGVPAPTLTGDSETVAGLEVQELAEDPRGLGTYTVGWQPVPGRWLTVTSSAEDPASARDRVLAVAATVTTDQTETLTAPVQFAYLPTDLMLAAVARARSPGPTADLTSTLQYVDAADPDQRLIVYAEHNPSDDGTGGPDTTVGDYSARYSRGSDGQQNFTLYGVDGYRINLNVTPELSDRVTEADLRRIAEEFTVVPGGGDIANWVPVPQP